MAMVLTSEIRFRFWNNDLSIFLIDCSELPPAPNRCHLYICEFLLHGVETEPSDAKGENTGLGNQVRSSSFQLLMLYFAGRSEASMDSSGKQDINAIYLQNAVFVPTAK